MGFTIVELLISLTIAAMLGLAIASALSASFMAYANSAETAGVQTSSRLIMQRLLTMVRTSTLHDAYDPNDPSVQLLAPTAAGYPRKCVGLQMILPDGRELRLWWAANTTYNQTDVGDLWYRNMGQAGVTGDEEPAEVMLSRVQCQRDGTKAYIFTLGSRVSEEGLLLTRVTVDLMTYPDPDATLEVEDVHGSHQPVRLVGSTMPRKTMEQP
jgi:type II secretory pathway pseudopilin PulG